MANISAERKKRIIFQYLITRVEENEREKTLKEGIRKTMTAEWEEHFNFDESNVRVK